MKKYNVYSVFFSATGNSKKGTNSIAKVFDRDFKILDFTVLSRMPIKTSFDGDDLIVIGAPVYGGRVFGEALERFSVLKGKNTPCIVTVSYGNRHYDDALLELCDFMKERGFIPFAAAALVGEHTFGNIQIGRPNIEDIARNIKFANDVIFKNTVEPIEVPGNRPYKEGGGVGAPFKPSTSGRCIKCGLCANNCPMEAISFEDYKTLDTDKCVACFRCIKGCPVSAKAVIDNNYVEFAKVFTAKLQDKKENEYFI